MADERICAACHKVMGAFKDKLSYRESYQSGLCQACQDEVFGPEVNCEYCNKQIPEEEAVRVEHHVYCSDACYGHDVGF